MLHENTPDLENENNSPLVGHWAIWPVLGRFSTSQRLAKWTLFCSAFVQIPIVEALIEHLLRNYDHSVPMFLGSAYFDESPVIIHHYHDGFIPRKNGGLEQKRERFPYPDISTGFLLSLAALKKIVEGIGKQGNLLPNFVIDPGFEFAQIVFALTGATLKEDSRFCGFDQSLEENGNCLIEINITELSNECDNMDVDSQKIFYAVKTHAGNHLSRVPIIKRTWAKQVGGRIGYFSDLEDKLIPTINLGVTNTERGHCGKTMAILQYFLKNISTVNGKNLPAWLVLADDDTLLSVPRLERFIRCFAQNEEKPIIVGQRYGYGFGVAGTNGYDYPTGGAGIIFSREAVEMLTNGCACPSIDSPDDMIIGLCARRLGIPIIHSAAFHQARPIDYPEKHLKMWAGRHISFHKFEELQVDEVYAELLHENGTWNDGNGQENHEEF